MSGTFRLVHCEFGFFFVLFCGTMLLTALGQSFGADEVLLSYRLFWSAFVAISSFAFLDALQYFDSFSPEPTKGKMIALFVALLPPFFIVKQIFFLFTGLCILRFRTMLVGLPFIALLCWIYQVLAGLRFTRSNIKRKVLLLLEDADRIAFQQELKKRGLEPYYEICEEQENLHLIVLSRGSAKNFETHESILMAHLRGVPVRDVRHLISELRGRESIEHLDLWFFLLSATPQRRIFRIFFHLKTLFEPLLAFVMLVLALPVIIFVAIGTKISSPGPILFKQKRTGYRGRDFHLVKFRSMSMDAEKSGPAWARQQSAYITRFGNFLRKSHLDEIPQLWNIMVGDMSFVGPRPERPEYYALLKKEIPLFSLRTMVRPGITGWAQVMGGYAATVAESQEKLEYDLYYMKRMSPVLDMVIFLKTLFIILRTKDELAE